MSVRQQTLDKWTLVVVAGHSTPGLGELREWADHDPRIIPVPVADGTSVAAALNAGMDRLDAPYLALLDQHDFLEPDALAAALRAAGENPDAEIIYTDCDLVDHDGESIEEFPKPDWSPERLRAHPYVAHLALLRVDAIRRAGGWRTDFDGVHDHDLLLRVSEQGAPVVHVARELYHRRSECRWSHISPDSAERGRRAVQEHLDRLGIVGRARTFTPPGLVPIDRSPRAGTRVSIVMPTRGGRHSPERPGRSSHGHVMAVDAVAGIVSRSYSMDYEIVVVHDREADGAYLDDLRRLAGERLIVVEVPGPFNFSRKINQGVEASTGDVIVMLNDDVQVITDRWLEQLVAIAQQEDVGAVGAKLLYADGTLQHGGLRYEGGLIGHISGGGPEHADPFGTNLVDREVVGVTAACLAQRRIVWDHLGGLDESLPVSFNDVDYCARMRAKGYRIVQANSVSLFHFESKTRSGGAHEWEVRRILGRLAADLKSEDPYSRRSVPFQDPVQSRSLSEWMRVSREVLATEGLGSFALKASRRVTRRRSAAQDTEAEIRQIPRAEGGDPQE